MSLIADNAVAYEVVVRKLRALKNNSVLNLGRVSDNTVFTDKCR